MLADRIVVMNRGRAEQVGSADDIYMRPASRFVADFIGSMNFMPTRVIKKLPSHIGTIECALGPIDLPLPPDVNENYEILLAMRPEMIKLQKETPAVSNNIWKGTIANAVFLGSVMNYYVKTKETTLQIQTGTMIRFQKGDDVLVEIDSEALRIVRR
jgi:ABC-type Fe3+/spermidine/putrescine transport system ATPase subunit